MAPHSVQYTISQVCLASCQPGMSPQSASRGPVERVYVQRIPCPDTEQLAASVGGLGRTYDDFWPIFGIPSWLMPLRDRSGQSSQPFRQGTRRPQRSKQLLGSLEPVGALVFSLSSSSRHVPFSDWSHSCGRHHDEGPDYSTSRDSSFTWFIDSRNLPSTHPFRYSQPFVYHITPPRLQLQIRGLDSAIRQATQAIHNGVHYIQELLTTSGMMHALNCDTTQLDAELRGCSTFPDPRLPSFPASPLGPTTTRSMTSTSSIPAVSPTPPPSTPTIRTPHRPVINRSSTAPSRSRSHPRLNLGISRCLLRSLFQSREKMSFSVSNLLQCFGTPFHISTLLVRVALSFPKPYTYISNPVELALLAPLRRHVDATHDDPG